MPMADEIAAMAEIHGKVQTLDLATGTGLLARAVAPSMKVVIGVDISPGILRRAKERSDGRLPFVAGDAHRLPFKGASFDLVLCGLSLSHFQDVDVVFDEVHRLLRPQGRLICSAWGKSRNPCMKAASEVRSKYLENGETAFGGWLREDLWEEVERGCALLKQAGFCDVKARTAPVSGRYRDHRQAIEVALAWPVTRYRMSRLTLSDQRKVKDLTARAIRQVSDLRWSSEIHYYEAGKRDTRDPSGALC
jgi:SAM-dependent methyltransferase